MCTTFEGVVCLGSECSASANLVLLWPGDIGLDSPAVAALIDIGSIEGSARRLSLCGCYFSSTTVSADWLGLPEQEGAAWGLFLRFELVPSLHVEIVCPKTLQYLQKRGRASNITCWDKNMPLSRTTFTEVGKSKSRSTSIRTLTYDSRVILVVWSSQCIGFPIILASLERQMGVQHLRGKFGNLTQVGIFAISVALKSKKSDMTFRMRGRPKT